MRIALLTMGSAASAGAVRRVIEGGELDIAVVGDSSPFRPPVLAGLRRDLKPLLRSWFLIAPFLLVNFVLPRLRPGRMAALCAARGIAFRTVDDVNAPATVAALLAAGAEGLVLYHFDQILTEATIAAFGGRVINVHPSLLPAHRGPVPTLHMLAQGGPAGVTIHYVAKRIDDGAVLMQAAMDLPAEASAIGAADLLHRRAVGMIGDAVRMMAQGVPGREIGPRLPYCGFPGPGLFLRRGWRSVRWRDVRLAWRSWT